MSDMGMDEDDDDGGGGDGWIMTFADLMSLLMCFFVLLLSFSEMDALKFKRLAGSMRESFGVQAELDVTNVPKGTSVIAQEFAPGRPDTTPVPEIWQRTTDDAESSLDVSCQDSGNSNSGETGDAQKLVVMDHIKDLVGETEQDGLAIATALATAIAEGKVEVEADGRRIIIRLLENGVFGSGSAAIASSFLPTARALRSVLMSTPGRIRVEGHTDNIPINTSRFPSNWALSAARSVSVTHLLMANGQLRPSRFEVGAYGETRPLESNSTGVGRERNRRVEIVIQQGLTDDVEREMAALAQVDPDAVREIEEETGVRFRLRPHEIF